MKAYRVDHIQATVRRHNLLRPIDILLVGGTGTGKSSTINALFATAVAKVGDGVDPETKMVSSYSLHDYLRVHDSPGLGDGKAADFEHAKNITYELMRTCNVDGHSYGFIDLVMVLLDGASRDLGTAFKLLESVVLKSIEPERVIVAINQADMAMKGRHWNSVSGTPDNELSLFLNEKALSVQRRIKDSTGLQIMKPVVFSAKYSYNIDVFLDHIILHLPTKRRVLL